MLQYFIVDRVSYAYYFFFFSSRRRHTRSKRDWSSDVCSSDLVHGAVAVLPGDPDLIRKLVRLDEIAAANLDAIQAQLGRDGVERALHDKACMWPAGAAIRRRRRGVGVDVAKPNAIVGHAIRTWHLRRGDDRQDDPVRGVGAAVVDEIVAEREQMPLGVEADLHLVDLAALLVDGGEMLLAVFGPLDRTPQPHRGERNEELVGVEEHDLRPEATTDIRRDDVDL